MTKEPKKPVIKGFDGAPDVNSTNVEPKAEAKSAETKPAERRPEVRKPDQKKSGKGDKSADAYEQRQGANIGGNGQPLEDTSGKQGKGSNNADKR